MRANGNIYSKESRDCAGVEPPERLDEVNHTFLTYLLSKPLYTNNRTKVYYLSPVFRNDFLGHTFDNDITLR